MDDGARLSGSGSGVGSSVTRKEDERHLRGQGQFIADISLPGMLEMAFLRSPVAHARIRAIVKPPGHEGQIFTAADLPGVQPIVANTTLPGFKPSAQPILATDKIRHVGEAVAVCVAKTRAEAEDLAAAVQLDLEELPAVHDMLAARRPESPLVHEHWADNVVLESRIETNFDQAIEGAEIIVHKELRTARQCMAPMEGRGVVAEWEPRLEQLLVHSSTQMPHVVRSGIGGVPGAAARGPVRVVSPDVGGGFGYKGILLPEEVVAPATWPGGSDRPVRWVEDRLRAAHRQRQLPRAPLRRHGLGQARTARCWAWSADATVDSGAYSCYPFSACLEAAQIGSDPARALHTARLPLPHRGRPATNKPGDPAVSRRGAHRRLLRAGDDCWTRWRTGPGWNRRAAAGATWCRRRTMPFR